MDLNPSERCAARAHSLTKPYSVLQPLYSAFLHVDGNKTAQKSDKTFHCWRFLLLKKTRKKKKRVGFLEQKQEHRVPLTTEGKCASEESDWSSERNSPERLKGRRFIPTGISCYSLSQSADRSFIEISAHLQQEIHPL